MRILRSLVAVIMGLVLISMPLKMDVEATNISVKRLTAWNMEKKSATATAGLRNLVVEGVGGQITALRIEPATLQVKKLVNIYSPGSLKGPSWAPGTVEVLSEPRLPRYGDWVYMIARSDGIRYIMSIHVTGGGAKYYRIPDTQIGDVKIRWSPVWFQLSLTGDRFMSVVSGKTISGDKNAYCTGLVTLSTKGEGFKILVTPKWDGEKFYHGDNDVGDLVAPIGMSRRSGELFFKAEVGNSGDHGIYTCKHDGSNLRLIKKTIGTYTNTISGSKACSLDYATDNGEYIILNDHNINHEHAVTIDTESGQIVAYLSHNCKGLSDDGMYSFFQDESGFGFEFTVGGNSFTIIKADDADYPATFDLNNDGGSCTPRDNVSVNPFGYLALSETDITSTGQVYFIGLTQLPVPKKSQLKVVPSVCDFGIIEDDQTVKLDIQNTSGTLLTGEARIESRQGFNPFQLSGKESVEFTNITDLVVYGNTESLGEGFTYERTIILNSNAGSLEVPMILTINNPDQLLARVGLDRTTAWISTEKVKLQVSPFLQNAITMVPLRFIIDMLPCDFVWDAENMKATIDYQDYHFEIGIGEDYCIIGNDPVEVSTPAVIKNGQTFIALRLVTEAFDAQIKWFGESRSILMSFPQPVWGRESLTVEGIPAGASVTVNYDNKGIAPLTLKHMKRGRYMVEVSKEGYKPYSTVIELPMKDKEKGHLLYFLERVVPTHTLLTVNSNPEGAYVYIGDTPYAKTPCEIEVEPGYQTLRVAHAEHPAHVEQIVCLAGEEMVFDIDFSDDEERLSTLMKPTSYTGEIDCNYDSELKFNVKLINQMQVPQAFTIECPDGLPIGFESVTVETALGQSIIHDTPCIAPGESLAYAVSVKTNSWISPGDELSADIVVMSKDFNSWQFRFPLKVNVTGREIGETKLEISAPKDVDVGETFDVLLRAEDVFDLNALTAKFIYNPNKIELMGVYQGDMFEGITKKIFSWRQVGKGEINIAGPVLLGDIPGVEGSGTLLVLKFKAKKDGEAVLDFSSVNLFNSDGEEMEHNIVNARVVVMWDTTPEPNPTPQPDPEPEPDPEP